MPGNKGGWEEKCCPTRETPAVSCGGRRSGKGAKVKPQDCDRGHTSALMIKASSKRAAV